MEVVPVSAGYRVVLHTAEDVGGEHFRDLVEFPPLSQGDEEDFGLEIATTVEALDALAMAEEHTGAVRDRWVNQGLAQDEYLDFVRAGRLYQSRSPSCGYHPPTADVPSGDNADPALRDIAWEKLARHYEL
ncbi:hypothetical protein Pth03_82180 [Planotetraspora thailandica]|uniref:Uncharacterized protein n=1 Tax=Planotetraspora thailandica TaxID=487172 RepID=A0A8J3Y2Y4_9ACTN|nr:hypothetical protein Pth03_82180 [Planotetraspora thailandica]